MFGWESFHDFLGGRIDCNDVTCVKISEAGAELINLFTAAAAVTAAQAMPVLGWANVIMHVVVFVSENVISFVSKHSQNFI